RDVLKRAVTSIPIKPVRKAARLADIEVVISIVIDVANRNAVVPVDINAASAVEHRSPVVRSVQKLRRIGRTATERGGRNVDIAGRTGPALRFIQHLPVPHLELTRGRPFPRNLPVTHALFTVEVVASGYQFIADTSLQLAGRYRRRHGSSVNTRHLKLSRKNL